ncbi:MAG: RNA ligase family protein [Actinomycetaceae bacterium]|nr:RNA ligase family protein [Actinomycetaceae bacterium]
MAPHPSRIKYPRTPHLPFSLGVGEDDRVLASDEQFAGEEVIVSVKMDGENTSVYADGTVHARSLDSKHRDYHSWLLQDVQNWCYSLPEDVRVCGEYLFARHSIAYNKLPSYFLVFSVWQERICLAWDDMLDVLCGLGDHAPMTVPVLYRGVYDIEVIRKIAEQTVSDGQEGVVVRKACSFTRDAFGENVAKYVRANHVQTDTHWMFAKIVKNELE